MKLKMTIHNIKCIKDLEIEFPTERGLYVITGQNGSGKSTIVACASSVFFNLPMRNYLGTTDSDSFINFDLDGAKRSWKKNNEKWEQFSEGKPMNIKGFYEGSLIFGFRFRDTSYDKLKTLESVDTSKLKTANGFIRTNLGEILQGDTNYYEKLWRTSPGYGGFDGSIFFYEKKGKIISQFHMSTGENLLISVLNSLYIRNKDRASLTKPCMIFLDEIELALHPSSLKRLVRFLQDMSDKYNYSIYFSTHSIELISGIKPDNIFFVERHGDNSIEILNPCYPAYATRILYDHSGYDNIILVEDDLAKDIITHILKREKLLNNRLVHVLPCGGYSKVIDLANDAIRNNLLGKKSHICMILDADIKTEAQNYISKNNISFNIPLNYLPVESLEKFLRSKLFLHVDHGLFRRLNDYIFQQKSLTEIIDEYSKNDSVRDDCTGKKLYSLIDSELRKRGKDRHELIEMVVDYLFESDNNSITEIVKFLQKQFTNYRRS